MILSILSNYSFKCEEMFVMCSLAGRSFDCCRYAETQITDLGRCYQFVLNNADEVFLHTQQQAGIFNGFEKKCFILKKVYL